MSISNLKVIDGIGINKEQDAIMLLLCDHLSWDREDSLKHSDHLLLLQKKINAYVAFLESGQYKENYPKLEPKMAIIDIRFQYEIPDTCERFLQVVQDQIGELGIKIEAKVGWANCI